MIRKREPRWQSAAERARVAAELIEEAESITEESSIASPSDVARDGLPPPLNAQLPDTTAAAAATPAAPPAAPSLDEALSADPDNAALLVRRAARLVAATHYRAAQLDYERALRSEPTNSEALTGLGVLLSRRGLWTDALPHLRRATEDDAGRAAGWYYLGEVLNQVDDLAGAKAAYERAIELEPRSARALHRLGIVLDRLNRPDEATRMYRRSREVTGR